jgi:hypothetical protein
VQRMLSSSSLARSGGPHYLMTPHAQMPLKTSFLDMYSCHTNHNDVPRSHLEIPLKYHPFFTISLHACRHEKDTAALIIYIHVYIYIYMYVRKQF